MSTQQNSNTWQPDGTFTTSNIFFSNRNPDEEKQTILDWLTPLDFDSQQKEFLEKSLSGTGRWFLESPKYQSWMDRRGQTLFCPGIPKSGKTILTAIVVDRLRERFLDSQTGIAYIYGNLHLQDQLKVGDLLASLLKQLSRYQAPLPSEVGDLYDRHKDRKTLPSLDEILMALHSIARMFSRVFIILDALDECQLSHGLRFLYELDRLQEMCDINILATSRFIPEIVAKFQGKEILEIRGSREDVALYLRYYMEQLPSFVNDNDSLRHEIMEKISYAADGMYVFFKQ